MELLHPFTKGNSRVILETEGIRGNCAVFLERFASSLLESGIWVHNSSQ